MSEAQTATVKKALVINETERILHYCETSTTTASVEGKDVAIPFHKSHALIPGVNVVDDDKWLDAFSKSPVFKFHRQKGALKVLQLPADKQGKQSLGLTGFDQDSAIEYVNKTFQLSLLEEWLAAETRSEVKDAIKKQHADVKKELEAPEEEDRIMFKAPAAVDGGHVRI